MSLSRIASNMRALLSTSKKKANEAGEVGANSPRVSESQHGSGSNLGTSTSTPQRVVNNGIHLYDEQALAALSDEEFNARIEESRAALASMKRPSTGAQVSSEDRLWRESNPLPSLANIQDDWRSGTGTDRTMKVGRSLDSAFQEMSQEQLPELDRKYFEGSQALNFSSRQPEGNSAAGSGSLIDTKNLVKIETLLKEFKAKLTGPSNFASWLVEMRGIGKFRRWPDRLLDAHTAQQIGHIYYSMDTRAREEAYLALRSTVASDIAYLFASVEFGHVEEAMKILRDKFTAVTVLQKQAANRDFTLLSQESTGFDVDSFAAAIKLEAGKLRDMGLHISEVEMSSTFLNGLLQDFHVIKAQMADETGLGNFDLVVSKVSNYAKNCGLSNKKVKSRKQEGFALTASAEKKQNECINFRDTGSCRFGDKCRYKHVKGKAKEENSKSNDECSKCGKTGHSAKDCKAPKPIKSSKGMAAPMVQEDDEESESGKGHHYALPMMMSVTAGSSAATTFGIDSFASSHLTNDRDDFIPGSLRAVKIDFKIGSGEDITVLEEGDINIAQGQNGEVVKLRKVGYYPGLPFKLISGGRLFQAGFQIEHGSEAGRMDICKDGVKVFRACVKDNVLIIEDIKIFSKGKCLATSARGSRDADDDPRIDSSKKLAKADQSLKQAKRIIPAEKFLEINFSSQSKVPDAAVVNNDNECPEELLDDNVGSEGSIMTEDKPAIEKGVQGTSELTIEEAHVRYGHVNIKTVCKILGLPPPSKDTPKIECESCEVEKQRKQSLPDKAQSRASRPMYRLHVDSSGKKSATEGGNHYFVVVVDDNSRKGWVLLAAAKSEIPAKIINLVRQLQAQHPARKLAFIRLDNAKEYSQQEFQKAVSEMGCTFEISAPYRQAQNGVAESRIGLTWKMAMSFLSHSAPDHPRSDWGYAVKHAGLIINKIPSDANGGLSPDDVWGDARSKLAIPGPLFCLCFAKVYVRGKMEPEAIKCVYMGNSEEHKAYLVRPIEGNHTSVLTSRDVTFFPSQMPYRHPTVRRPVCVADDEQPEESNDEAQDEEDIKVPVAPKAEEPQNEEPQGAPVAAADIPRGFNPGSKVYVVDQHERTKQWKVYEVTVDSVRDDGVWIKFRGRSEAFGGYTPDVDVFRSRTAAEKLLASQEKANPCYSKGSVLSAMSEDDKRKISSLLETDPETRSAMLVHPHRNGYIAAEEVEMIQLAEQNVWKLVKRTKDMHVLDCRWVYKAKRDLASGEITKYRSRLVAKGFKERYGMEFWETFSSNVKLEDVRLMLALVTYYDYPLWHFDIKAYFLYGAIEELVYMRQPEGYHEGPARNVEGEQVCQLLKAIYGTKQAQRCADKELKKAFADEGVLPVKSDNSLYYARDGDKVFFCGMYVDDGLCFGNNEEFVQEKLKGIARKFELVVVEEPKVFVGIQIERDRNKGTMLLHQEGAVMKLLGSIGMMDCKPSKTPMQLGLVLDNPAEIKMSDEVRAFPYQSLVGQLLWLLGTRIDVCFAINVLSRYMSNWSEQSITMLKRVVRYLKGKEKYGLVYLKGPKDAKIEKANQEPTKARASADADHASRIYDSKTTGSSILFFANNIIGFNTKTQEVGISTSSGEAEGKNCKLACQSIEWQSELLKELQIRGTGPIPLEQDNQSVINLSINPVNHKRSKHYRVAMAYIRDLVERRITELHYCPSEDMVADVLTKALPEAQHWKLLKLARFGKFEWF